MLSKSLKIDGQKASRYGATVTEIFSMDDFPAPAGGVITLPSGEYIIHASLTTSDRFLISTGQNVFFTMKDSRNLALTYTGTGTMFTLTNPGNVGFDQFQFVCSGEGAQFIDSTGGAVVTIDLGRIALSGSGSSIGTIDGCSTLVMTRLVFENHVDGVTLKNISIILIDAVSFVSAGTGVGSLINIQESLGLSATINTVVAIVGASESAFDIEPCIAAPVNISQTVFSGVGDFFKTGVTGAIGSFVDTSTGTTAVTVTDSGGDALFASVAHGLNVGESPIQTTFTQPTYNGTFVVTEKTADTYKCGIDYVANDSGLFATTTCLVNSELAHGRSNGECVSIFETVNFGGGYNIFNAQTNTFEITLGKAFPGTETTGNWDTSSLTQQDKYVNTRDNGALPNSQDIGAYVVGGNATPTTINTQDVFEDLNLGSGAAESIANEGWTLIDPVTGEMRYDGLSTVSKIYSGHIYLNKAGSSQSYVIRLLKNDAELPSPDNVDIEREVTTIVSSTGFEWSIVAAPGDAFKLVAANSDGTDNLIVSLVKAVIS